MSSSGIIGHTKKDVVLKLCDLSVRIEDVSSVRTLTKKEKEEFIADGFQAAIVMRNGSVMFSTASLSSAADAFSWALRESAMLS